MRTGGLSFFGTLVVLWAVGGIVAILVRAILALSVPAAEAFAHPLGPFEIGVLVTWVIFCGFAEGYRGFQKQYSPRVVARAMHLGRHPRALHVLLAPLHASGLVHATRRRLVTSWSLVIGIAFLVLAVRQLPQPWRGIVDAGVVLGLTWGTVAIGWFLLRALRGHEPTVSPDLPAPS